MAVTYPGPPAPVGAPAAAKSAGDRRLAVLAGACLAVSVAGIVLRALHLMPSSAATGLGLAAVAIALRILLLWTARSASDAHRAKILNRVSLAGLAISGAVLVITIPKITKAGGTGMFFSDAFAHAWTLVLVTIAAGTVRTFTWRVYLGAGLTGLLAVNALVRLVSVPLYNHFGPDSLLENAAIAPAIEEVFKALLLVLIVWLSARRRELRPSAVDIALLGMWVGGGFALYEDATFGRGGVYFGDAAPFSVIFPTQAKVSGLSQVGAGHLLYTGVVGLGLGVGVLYRRRWRFAWLAVPAGFFVAFAEHASWNGKAMTGDAAPSWVGLLAGVTLAGRLSSVVLIGGIGGLVWFEWRRATQARLDPAGYASAGAAAVPGFLSGGGRPGGVPQPHGWPQGGGLRGGGLAGGWPPNGGPQPQQAGKAAAASVPRWLWLTAGEAGRRMGKLAELQRGGGRPGAGQVASQWQGPYQQGPYQAMPNQPGPYQAGPPPQGPYQPAPYRQGPFGGQS